MISLAANTPSLAHAAGHCWAWAAGALHLGLLAPAGGGVELPVRSRSRSRSRHLNTALSRLDELQGRDPLTGLVTRPDFEAALDGAVLAGDSSASALALLYVGLDNFRPLNDGDGHRGGDAVLVQAAQRLQACTSRPLAVSRVGGDKFALLVGAQAGGRRQRRRQGAACTATPFHGGRAGVAPRCIGALVHWCIGALVGIDVYPGRGDVRAARGCNGLQRAATGCKAICLPSR